jgi:CoA:oxalate CoA-transferase
MQLADKHEGTTTKAFAGLRVLDFSTTIAGPHCARMLADMGAEVIKIETDGGETMRTRPPVRHCRANESRCSASTRASCSKRQAFRI